MKMIDTNDGYQQGTGACRENTRGALPGTEKNEGRTAPGRKDRTVNLLFTSFGKRAYLADYFARAMSKENLSGMIYAGDCTGRIGAGEAAIVPVALPPILGPAEQVTRPERTGGGENRERVPEGRYVSFLLAFCRAHRIDLLIPLIDLDVWVLSRYRDFFAAQGTCLLSPDPESTDCCEDKAACMAYLRDHGIPVPVTAGSLEEAEHFLSEGTLTFPLIIKPAHGNGSLAAYEVTAREELPVLIARAQREAAGEAKIWTGDGDPKLLIQQKIETKGVGDRTPAPGALLSGEYGLDVICDLEGTYQTTLIRRKVRMARGETMEAVTLDGRDAPPLLDLGEKLAALFHPRVLLDVDVIVGTDGRTPCVLDVNPRFGGGFPFSFAAGCDLPAALLEWVLDWRAGRQKSEEGAPGARTCIAPQGRTEVTKERAPSFHLQEAAPSSDAGGALPAGGEGPTDPRLALRPGIACRKVVTVVRTLPAGSLTFRFVHDPGKIERLLGSFGELVTPPLSERSISLRHLAEKIAAQGFALVCVAGEAGQTAEKLPAGKCSTGETPVSFAWGYANGGADGKSAVISFLAVLPAYRNCHIGERMIRICEDRARKQGLERMCFTASRTNSQALRLYLRLGYGIAGREETLRFLRGAAG